MNATLYRCGWCGHPTQENGKPLNGTDFEKAVRIIEGYGDGKTLLIDGWCCSTGF